MKCVCIKSKIKRGLQIKHGIQSTFLACLMIFKCGYAAENSPDVISTQLSKITYKFTTTYLGSSDDNNAIDVNLRAVDDMHTAWVGEYGDRNGFRQLRAGYAYSPQFNYIRPTFSIQLATKGYIAESISAEIGDKNFAILGIARTNLQEYYDLGHDPNDAITFGVGSRALENNEFYLFQIFDNRLHTQQRNNHLMWRYKFANDQRLVIDASYKTGLNVDNVFIHGYGLSVDYDYKQYFVRIACDEFANFNPSNQTRLSAGFRF